MNTFAKTPINAKGQQFIRVGEPVWEDGLKISEKVGFIEVKPEAADRNLAKLQAGEIVASFGDKNTQTNLYEIVVTKPESVGETSNELQHASN